MIELDDERDPVRPVARHGAEHAERRGDRVAPALDGELDELAGVEVLGIGSERRAGRVLDALVDREDRHVAGAAEPAVLDRSRRGCAGRGWTVGARPDAIDEIRSGQVQHRLGHRLAFMLEQGRGVVAEQLLDGFGCWEALRLPWVSPDACRRSVWTPLPNLPGRQLPGQRSPSSTVSADGTPAHPWRASARRERRDLREQERFPAGDGGGAAHRPGGRAGQRARYRGHLDDGPDARARGGRGRRIPTPTPGGCTPLSCGPPRSIRT